ncbi:MULTISPECIES: hypothetical protein [unclassified Brenneria]|uniref:hypothetical protein n=1 Tax=unclassified Brenneria TaxID=2634434 RepID=UPI0018F0C334|nr:hypothetical protein [Brenneria sp. L3-3C-1]MBJ7221595.1 hypothetical protein [Brenneria sp. L3-3C-1]MEE3642837.1 hypothetical protein [Brenneria sp. L3_3C_1]
MAIFLVVFVLFSFIIDSGGPLGIRMLALGLAILGAGYNFFRKKAGKIDLNFFLAIFLLLIFSVLGFLSSALNGITLSAAYIWILPVISVPIFYLFFTGFKSEDLISGVVGTGWAFSAVIIFTFLSLYFYGEGSVTLIEAYEFPGWFYIRPDGYPQVYFQATLVLVLITIYSYFKDYKKSAYFFCFILLLCLSRFGFSTSFAFILLGATGALLFIRKYIARIFILQSFIFIVICLILYLQVGMDYVMDGSGFHIRQGHLISIFNSMSIENLIIGMGPGSEVYSIGFEKFTDNIEISQLELIRKYGLLGYFVYSFAFFFLLMTLVKKNKFPEVYALYGFYIASYSNPVLLSFSFSVFAGCFLATKNRTISYPK